MAGLPRTLLEIVRKVVEGTLQGVHVSLPGQVVRYDAAANLADVQVMVKHPVYDDDNIRSYEEIGTLTGVPVEWPRAGGFILTMPLTEGDTGRLTFASTPIGEWRSSNQLSEPADASRLDIGWPTFTPGLSADNNAPSSADANDRANMLVLGKDGTALQIRINGSTIDIGNGASDFVALASKVDAAIATIIGAFGPTPPAVTPEDGGATLASNIYKSIKDIGSVAAIIARAK